MTKYKIWTETEPEKFHTITTNSDEHNIYEAERVAENYADYYYHHMKGYEKDWPIKINIESEDGKFKIQAKVRMEMEPKFTCNIN